MPQGRCCWAVFPCVRRNSCDTTLCRCFGVKWAHGAGQGWLRGLVPVVWWWACSHARVLGASPPPCTSCVLIWASFSLVKRCSKPPAIPHGWHSGLAKAVFAPGTSVSYSCEPGFALTGMASIHCTESGAWSHPPPVCQGVCLLQRTKKKGHLTLGVP